MYSWNTERGSVGRSLVSLLYLYSVFMECSDNWTMLVRSHTFNGRLSQCIYNFGNICCMRTSLYIHISKIMEMRRMRDELRPHSHGTLDNFFFAIQRHSFTFEMIFFLLVLLAQSDFITNSERQVPWRLTAQRCGMSVRITQFGHEFTSFVLTSQWCFFGHRIPNGLAHERLVIHSE